MGELEMWIDDDLKKENKKMSLLDLYKETLKEHTYHLQEDADEAAEELGCYAVYPDCNQIQIDIDDEKSYDIFKERISKLKEITSVYWDNFTVEEHPSKSGLPKRHITVSFFNENGSKVFINDTFRISLQYFLGSDTIRELYNMYRYISTGEALSRFFEKK